MMHTTVPGDDDRSLHVGARHPLHDLLPIRDFTSEPSTRPLANESPNTDRTGTQLVCLRAVFERRPLNAYHTDDASCNDTSRGLSSDC